MKKTLLKSQIWEEWWAVCRGHENTELQTELEVNKLQVNLCSAALKPVIKRKVTNCIVHCFSFSLQCPGLSASYIIYNLKTHDFPPKINK